MTAQDRYQELLRAHIAPALREVGFKKNKGNFHRPIGPNWGVINFQASAYSDRGLVSFTVNLGVGVDGHSTDSLPGGRVLARLSVGARSPNA